MMNSLQRFLWAATVVAAGCGRFDFASLTLRDDAAGDGAEAGDANRADAAPLCAFGAFSPPRLSDTLNSADIDWGPSLSADQLTVVFSSHPSSGAPTLLTSTRASTTTVWAMRLPIESSTGSITGEDPFLSRDGLTLYYDHAGIHQLTRAAVGQTWANETIVASDTGQYTEPSSPELTNDDLHLLFSAHVTAEGGTPHLFTAKRANPGASFATATEITELSTSAGEASPSITTDGLEVFFQQLDTTRGVFHAARATTADPFGPPVLLTELGNFGDHKVDADISVDGKTLAFSSDKNGSYDVWFATRECL